MSMEKSNLKAKFAKISPKRESTELYLPTLKNAAKTS